MRDETAEGAGLRRADAERPEDGASGSRQPSASRRALRILLPLLVIAAGIGLVLILRATAPAPPREDEGPRVPTVEVTRVQRETATPEVSVHGTVVAAREARVAPDVAGRVVWVSPSLIAGGRFEAGDPMLRIDARDYRLALEAQRGEVAQAEMQLAQTRAEAEVARRIDELHGADIERTPEGQDLALKRPQLDAARQSLASARSRLQQTREQLGDTTLRAPFASLVSEAEVEQGQQVSAQQPVATLVGTDVVFVHASVPVEVLPALRIPADVGSGERGSAATVIQEAGRSTRATWTGYVAGMLPGVDERGAMARLVIAVPDPMGLAERAPERAVPLLLGTFVEVELDAAPIEDVARLPAVAVHGERTVWLVDEDGRLVERQVELRWRGEETVLVGEGLREGERVVVSRLASPAEGMEVRVTAPAQPTDRARDRERDRVRDRARESEPAGRDVAK